MSQSFIGELKSVKGWLRSHGTRALDALAYSGRLPSVWAERRVTAFWNRQAPMIHAQWGRGDWDFPVLGRIIDTYRPRSVLDIGCGSGRLFGLYRSKGIRDILGIDLSADALRIAARGYPDIPTIEARLEEATWSHPFDLIVSNRVLQHVSPKDIEGVVQRLCATAALVYLNELSDSDRLPEEFFMVKHDYAALFAAQGWQVIERGQLGRQTYLVLQAGGRA